MNKQLRKEANDILNTMGYKQGRFENFNLLGVVTSPRMLNSNDTSSSENHHHNSNLNGMYHPNNGSSSRNTAMNSVSSSPPSNNTNSNTNANNSKNSNSNSSSNTRTPSSPITAFGIESYVDPKFLTNLSNVSKSLTKEIESLNSTLYSYSNNYLGGNGSGGLGINNNYYYASLSNAMGGLLGGNYGYGYGGDNTHMSSLDCKNELLHSIQCDRGEYKARSVDELLSELVDLGKKEKFWHSDVKHWTGHRVTVLWSSIWSELHPYLGDKTGNKVKSRDGQISWRTCYNKMQVAGLFKGNKVQKK